MKTRNLLLRTVLLLSGAMLLSHGVLAASIEYPALGNIRSEAGTVELWFELPFDVLQVKPETLWFPCFLFQVFVEGDSKFPQPLLLRFQSIPATRDEKGQIKRGRTDGLCFSARGAATYLTYEQIKLKGNQLHHLAIAWEGRETWFYSNGALMEYRNAGVAGEVTDALLDLRPSDAVVILGERQSARQLLRVHAIRISNVPRQFVEFTSIPEPRADINTLLLDRFVKVQPKDGNETVTLPEKISSLDGVAEGRVEGEWHRGHSTSGDFVAFYKEGTPLEKLELFGLPAQ